jgi:putative ABC transport system permease protein
MGLFILTALYAEHEFSFDSFHKNADRIYSLIKKYPEGVYGGRHTGMIPAPLLPTLLSEFPGIEDGTRLVSTSRRIVRYKDKKFYENSILFVDANFLTFFSFGMIAGNPETALVEPLSIVLTESMAHKYFGNKKPVGQVLTLDNKVNLKVTGVTKDVPSNSGLRYNCLISMNNLKWQNDPKIGAATFLLLEKMADRAKLEKKFPAFIKKHMRNSPNSPARMYLFPLKDLYLKSSHIPGHWYINLYFRGSYNPGSSVNGHNVSNPQGCHSQSRGGPEI